MIAWLVAFALLFSGIFAGMHMDDLAAGSMQSTVVQLAADDGNDNPVSQTTPDKPVKYAVGECVDHCQQHSRNASALPTLADFAPPSEAKKLHLSDAAKVSAELDLPIKPPRA